MSVLTFAEDFTSSIQLDSQLRGVPSSGLYWNRGTHPLINVNNLIQMSSAYAPTFSTYSDSTTYSTYTTDVNNIVTYNGVVYQSLVDSNIGNTPSSSPLQWLETNVYSLRLKHMINEAKENMVSSVTLSRALIENQYLYNLGEADVDLDGDFSGWAFEPKNSDYVKIRINQIALQANTDTPQNLYVINQGVLVDTLVLNPNNGLLEFEQVDYTISGKGAFYFWIDSQSVKSNRSTVDVLKYKGFIAYPVQGNGATVTTTSIKPTYVSNGLNFNVSCYLDSSVFIENNLIDFARLWQLQFAYDFIQKAMYNTEQSSNRTQRMIDANLLQVENLDVRLNTIAKKYEAELSKVKTSISRTFDAFLKPKKGLTIKRTTL